MNEAGSGVGAGFLAFVAFVVLALALWFLMRNMNARMRRMSYRQQRAHRGRDDAQVGPEEISDDEPGADEPGGPDGRGEDAPPAKG